MFISAVVCRDGGEEATLGTRAVTVSSLDELESCVRMTFKNPSLRVKRSVHFIDGQEYEVAADIFSSLGAIRVYVEVAESFARPCRAPTPFQSSRRGDSPSNDTEDDGVAQSLAERFDDETATASLRDRVPRQRDTVEGRLNEELRALTIEDILSGSDGRRMLECIHSGESFDADVHARNMFKRRLGAFLLNRCDRRNSPRPDEVCSFVDHICSPFPQINQSRYIGHCKAILFEYIYNRRQQMKREGQACTRVYRKCAKLNASTYSIEHLAELNSELQRNVDGPGADRLIQLTRPFRRHVIEERKVAGAFDAVRQLHDPSVILDDFQDMESVDVAAFFGKWPSVVSIVAGLVEVDIGSARRTAWESTMGTLTGEDRNTNLTLVRIMLLLQKEDRRKKLFRLEHIFRELPKEPDASSVGSALASKRTEAEDGRRIRTQTQPLVVQYGGNRRQFGVFVQGNEILCNDGLLHALTVALAAHYVFGLKWDREVTDVWFILLRLLGLPTWGIKSNVARVVADTIEANLKLHSTP